MRRVDTILVDLLISLFPYAAIATYVCGKFTEQIWLTYLGVGMLTILATFVAYAVVFALLATWHPLIALVRHWNRLSWKQRVVWGGFSIGCVMCFLTIVVGASYAMLVG
jgi:hypothetical protein